MNAATISVPLTKRKSPTPVSSNDCELCCTRCGGLLVEERCMDIGESLGGYWFMAMRCVQCGDIIDEVILRNRYAQVASAEAIVRAA